MGRYLGEIITIAILIGLNGYFAAAEIALVSARRTALQQSAERGSAGARAALRLLDDPNRLLSTISVAITLVGFSAASLAAVTFDGPLTAALTAARIPGSPRWPRASPSSSSRSRSRTSRSCSAS